MNPESIGQYRILDKLGSGGMGQVYLGEHKETGEKAAVKVLTASLARESGFVERFNREIDAMRKLESPHIVKLYDSGIDGENYYYAMEYVAGETLLDVMRREKRLDWKRSVDVAIQICQALKSAHDAGIVHRDLKPSNLMVTDEGTIKLTDFGVAQVFASSRLTVTGGIIGTAEYMSPEQAQGKRATKQSDLYSLGAVMYAMITGRTPFSGSTAVEVIQKHKFGLYDRPSLIVPNLPQRVEETICKLLEKDPAKRFPDAYVLLRHLEQLVRLHEFASAGVTLTDFSQADSSDTTVATLDSQPGEAAARSPGQATLMQGLIRAEIDEINRGHWLTGLFNSLPVQIAMLALVVAGGVWWFQAGRMTPQERFDRGVALLAQEPGPEWSRARREFFEPLVEADSGAWGEKVAPYLKKIELYELMRPTRGNRRGNASAESEPQRLLQLAEQCRQSGDLARAERMLVSLEALLAGDEQYSQAHAMAVQLLDEVRRQRERLAGRDELLAGATARAEALANAGDQAGARAIWQAIVDLYGDEREPPGPVERAKKALADSAGVK